MQEDTWSAYYVPHEPQVQHWTNAGRLRSSEINNPEKYSISQNFRNLYKFRIVRYFLIEILSYVRHFLFSPDKMAATPSVTWAQRPKLVFLTINVREEVLRNYNSFFML